MPICRKTSRREFLRLTAAAGCAAAPWFVPSHVLGRCGRPGASAQIVLGIIGMGQRGNQLLDNIPDTGRVAAICDADARKMGAALQAHAADWATYQDYRKMLDRHDLDAVIVCPCDHHHVLASILACQAGKDVYCEKPLSLYIREGRALVRAARRYNRVVQTGTQQRTMELNRFACEFVRDGGIGAVRAVECVNFSGPIAYPEQGLPEEPVPAGVDWDLWQGQAPAHPFNRQLFAHWTENAGGWWGSWRDYSNGQLTGLGSHAFDMVQYALGMDETGPVELWPVEDGPRARLHFRYANGVEVRLRFPDEEPYRGPRLGAIFIGADCKMEINRNKFTTNPPDFVRDPPDPHLADKWEGEGWIAKGHVQNWFDCIKTRAKPHADVEIGHRTASLCQLLVIVRLLGRRLKWDPEREKFPDDEEANQLLDRPRRSGWELPDVPAPADMGKARGLGRILGSVLLLAALLLGRIPGLSAQDVPSKSPASESARGPWILPDARNVTLGGALGSAYHRGVARLSEDPYRSAAFLRSDFSFEQQRVFTNYSGDISGRFIEIASLISPPRTMTPPTLADVLQDIASFQQADGHFGRDVDWSQPLEPESPHNVMLPIFWGNSRLLMGLLEAHRNFGREDLLQAAARIGDFYIHTADRMLDPAREPEYRSTGTYAAGYVTDYFPGIDGLVQLYHATSDQRYLEQAERMAAFFARFDTLPIDHSHGNLITHYGLLSLYETTGKRKYLDRVLRRWQEAVEGGYIWPLGGVGERFRISWQTDEGCSEADWLRLNLRLWQLTCETRYLDMAERLLRNHYAMNRTSNGGYGHHNFVCDAEGPLLMQPEFTEAVWCCTFHGLLGLHTVKQYVVVGSPRGIFINFPVDVSTTLEMPQGPFRVQVTCHEEGLGVTRCHVRIDPLGTAAKLPPVFLRCPSWTDQVQLTDRAGRELAVVVDGSYRQLPVDAHNGEEVVAALTTTPRVEDRRLRPVAIDPHTITRHRGVVLCQGARVLLANAQEPRPVVVATVGAEGTLTFAPDSGTYEVATVTSLDATHDEIATAGGSGPHLRLGPWEAVDQSAPIVFVFDVIAVPVSATR